MEMVKEKTWKEFRDSGLLWFINTTLQLFGWSIVLEIDDKKIVRGYPARNRFRGFSEDATTEGYTKVTEYLKTNIDSLVEDLDA